MILYRWHIYEELYTEFLSVYPNFESAIESHILFSNWFLKCLTFIVIERKRKKNTHVFHMYVCGICIIVPHCIYKYITVNIMRCFHFQRKDFHARIHTHTHTQTNANNINTSMHKVYVCMQRVRETSKIDE